MQRNKGRERGRELRERETNTAYISHHELLEVGKGRCPSIKVIVNPGDVLEVRGKRGIVVGVEPLPRGATLHTVTKCTI